MNLTEILNDKARVINSQVQQLITIWNLPQPLKEAILYVLEAGGKRIRPILTLFACEAVNGKIDSVMQAAVAIELIHNASLLWDDVIWMVRSSLSDCHRAHHRGSRFDGWAPYPYRIVSAITQKTNTRFFCMQINQNTIIISPVKVQLALFN